MSTSTPRLGLIKPATSEAYDISIFNGNADKLDADLGGLTIATSTTRPSTPYDGQGIFESDSGNVLWRHSSTWKAGNGKSYICTSGTRPASGLTYGGFLIYETDTGNSLIRNAANTAWLPLSPYSVADATAQTALGVLPEGFITYRRDNDMFYRTDGAGTWTSDIGYYRKTQILGSSSSFVTFTPIPSNLKTLKVVWSARSTNALVLDELRMRVNNNSGSNYFSNQAIQVNTTVTASCNSGFSYTFVGQILGASASNANGFGTGTIEIPGWNNPNTRGQLNIEFESHAFDTAANSSLARGGALINIVGPYTRLDFFATTGSLATGTEITLYGWE